MKNFIIVVLIVGAIGYYFDISPTDFLPSLPNSTAATDRHASAGARQAPAASAQPTVASTPIPNSADGSMANRWKTSASPPKP